MKTKKTSGIVLWYNEKVNQGEIRVSGEKKPLSFSLNSQRAIFAGATEPEFGTKAPASSLMPQIDAQVAVLLGENHKLEVTPDRRTLRRYVNVAGWDYMFSYQDARRAIAARPEYEVWEFCFYNGAPSSVSPNKLAATGTAAALQAKHPRGAVNDPLAPEAKLMGFTYTRRFCKKGRPEQWVEDPRSVPTGAAVEKVVPVNRNGEVLADEKLLLELAASAGGRRNGTTTPHRSCLRLRRKRKIQSKPVDLRGWRAFI